MSESRLQPECKITRRDHGIHFRNCSTPCQTSNPHPTKPQARQLRRLAQLRPLLQQRRRRLPTLRLANGAQSHGRVRTSFADPETVEHPDASPISISISISSRIERDHFFAVKYRHRVVIAPRRRKTARSAKFQADVYGCARYETSSYE